MKEIWKIYLQNKTKKTLEISNFGRLKVNGQLYEPKTHGRYHSYHMIYIHRMVAETFIPNPENKPQVDHIDADRYNNHVSNLRWVTSLENSRNPNSIEKQKATQNQPERKAARIKKLKEFVRTHPEWKEAISKRNKEYYSDTNNRKKHSERMKNTNFENLKGMHKGKKYLTDGFVNVFVKPEYWGEFIDIGFNFGRTILNNKKKK